MTIRVLIADDQAMVRSGLRLILDDQPGITVIGEAADGADAVAQARRLRPDVCLVDIRMPAPGRDRGHPGPGRPRRRRPAPGRHRHDLRPMKLGLRNRVEIAAWAWETGRVTPAGLDPPPRRSGP